MLMMMTTMTMIKINMRMVELTLVQNISAWSDQFPSHVTSPVYIQTLHQEDRDTPAQTGTRSRTSSVGSSSHWGTGLGPRGHHGQGYLCPRLEGCSSPLATLWYDWFLPETSPDPTQVRDSSSIYMMIMIIIVTMMMMMMMMVMTMVGMMMIMTMVRMTMRMTMMMMMVMMTTLLELSPQVSLLEDLFLQVGGVKCWTGHRLVSPLLLSNTHPQYRDWCRAKLDLDPDLVLESGYVEG